MRRIPTALFLATTLLVAPAAAVQPDERLADPALETRARALSAELRCLVCQNQSIDDSNAQLAKDLRVIVRERLVAGDTDAEVLDFLEARYGEFVLLKPRFEAHTLVLWLAGPVLLVVGAAIAWLSYRRRARLAASGVSDAALSVEERAAVDRLMKGGNEA